MSKDRKVLLLSNYGKDYFIGKLCFIQCFPHWYDAITSWQIDGETVRDIIFSGSEITADADCCHEIKRCLLLEEKPMTTQDSILKSRDNTLWTKVCLVKAMEGLMLKLKLHYFGHLM